MKLILRTFGSIELVTAAGHPVPGAGVQPKPLLILALAALSPDGIGRDRLVRALWPGVARDRARASLKQHLYGLRRAIGDPAAIGGTLRITVNPDILRVDAQEFNDHVAAGRLAEAGRLLRGDLLEGAPLSGNPHHELDRIVRELRDLWAPRVALVRSRTVTGSLPETIREPSMVAASRATACERELRAASRRFVQGLITLPPDAVAGGHRVSACAHDLLETIATAELADVSRADINRAIGEARDLWARVDGVRQLRERREAGAPDSTSLEWLIHGECRTDDLTGQALERHVMRSTVATMLRDHAQWATSRLVQTLRAPAGAQPPRVLVIGGAGVLTRADDVLPLLLSREASLVVNDVAEDTLLLAADRFGALGRGLSGVLGDTIMRIDEIAALGPYDLILFGPTFDMIPARSAEWLVARLIRMLAQEGKLCFVNQSRTSQGVLWLKYFADWSCFERDQQDLGALVPAASAESFECRADPTGDAWWVTIHERPLLR